MTLASRRKLITAAAGVSGLAAAAKIASAYGLVPPDSGSIYGLGATLTYASHRLLTGNSAAREFRRDQISTNPFANGKPPEDELFKKHEAAGFSDWKLTVDGLVERPITLSIPELRKYPVSSQITQVTCEEGWTYVAEWTGVALSHVLNAAGVKPEAKWVTYWSIENGWWDSIDLHEAVHPQTLVSYGMNGGQLPVGFGGPLRIRVPRQLGYKSVKYINRIVVTDDLKQFGKGLGSAAPEAGYSWYAGI